MRSILDVCKRFWLLTVTLIVFSISLFAQVQTPIASQAWIQKSSLYVGAAVMVFEYMLANTKWIQANSTIDLVINFIKTIFGLSSLGGFKK